MTSTSAGSAQSSAQPRNEIEALFSWNPPRLFPVKKLLSTPGSTRPPSFYDKHFSDNLVLKRVVPFPSLVQQLAGAVDKALDSAASETLPPLANGFVTASRREHEDAYLPTEVSDEKGVAAFYDKTTVTYCARIASTLILHPTALTWGSFLQWTQSVTAEGCAIMDGMLYLMPIVPQAKYAKQHTAMENCMKNFMEHEIYDIVQELRKSRSPLATWEMKSLTTGTPDIMSEVPNLGKFSWATCDLKNCTSLPKHQRAIKKVGQVKVGPDAQNPPWVLPVNRGEETNIEPPETLQQLATRRVTRSAARRLHLIPPPPGASHSSGSGPSTRDKGKKRRREDDEDEREDEDNPYPARPLLTAQNLVQQAWAQAVRVDGTVIVLHSGNRELVCVRHRETQTLYVSNIVEPPECVNPGYGKLHIGIYIAAIKETIDRRLQLKRKPPGHGGSDLIDSGEDQDRNQGSGSGRKDGHGRGRAGRSKVGRGRVRRSDGGKIRGSAGRKGPTDDELINIEAIHATNSHNGVLLYLQYGIYDSVVPALFIRSAPPIMAHKESPNRLEEYLTIVVTSEIGQGATGMAHRGTLKLELQSGTVALDVVVKLAFNTGQRDALENEYEIYRYLQSKGVRRGVATTLGIFHDSEDAAYALVMLYAGVPLCKELQGDLSIPDCESALSTLKCIHHAGILHGDIRQENLLISDSGITIVDFGHSTHCNNQGVKTKELALLRDFLGLAS